MMRKLTYLMLPLALAAALSVQASAGPLSGPLSGTALGPLSDSLSGALTDTRLGVVGSGLTVAAGGCGRAAAQAAASTGGQVIGVRQAGQSCIVTVLVPGRGGNPPRRVVMTLPAG